MRTSQHHKSKVRAVLIAKGLWLLLRFNLGNDSYITQYRHAKPFFRTTRCYWPPNFDPLWSFWPQFLRFRKNPTRVIYEIVNYNGKPFSAASLKCGQIRWVACGESCIS
jgi:hypothetical protein